MPNGERFYIYENWQAGPRKAGIHRGSCGHCKDGRGKAEGHDPAHDQWHGPYVDIATARAASQALPNIINRYECACV
jgi:hypothetical protein